MKIGVDARALATIKSGVGYYVASVLEQLAIIDQENEYYLYSNKPFLNTFRSERFHCRISKGRFNNWWVQAILPGLLVEDNIDVFWGGGFILPFSNSKIKKVVTIHDFVFHRYPRTLPLSLVLHFRLGMHFYIRCADHVLVDSENTDRDLRQIYHYPSSKITVAHLAAREIFFNALSKSDVEETLAKYQLKLGYFLFVGTVEPRKGVDTILKALFLYKKRVGKEVPFIIVGQIGWKSKEIITLLNELSLENSVRFLEYVPDDDMAAIYQGAKIFVYPSLYEGFGLPVLEAMASGVPVITSTASSLPEVAGDAALYINPGDEQALSLAFEKVLKNPKLVTALIQKGKIQARQFSWEKTAEKTLQAFRSVESLAGEV